MSELTQGPLSDRELAAIVNQEISEGLGSDQDSLVGEREEALEYYFQRLPKAPAIAGRSAARSNDVADMVEALLAQIMPTFSGDTVATFEAQNEQDEQQAQLESDVVNYYIMERTNGYTTFYESIKDALLLKNGIVKIFVDQGEKVEITEYPPLDELQLAALQAQDMEAELIAEHHDGGTTVKAVKPYKRFCCEAVAPEDFVISSDARGQDLNEVRFCSHQRVETQTSLLEMGIDPAVVLDCSTWNYDVQVDQLARNQADDEDEYNNYQDSTRPIRVWETYIRVDYDGDGIAELRKVLTSDENVLMNEVVKWVPFASGTPFMNPHRWVGISLFDKLKDIADQKTTYLRQYSDNMVNHNNRRLAAQTGLLHDINDVVNSRPGGVIRTKGPGAIQEIPVSDIGPSCITALGYLDKQRTERAGASLDMQSEGLPTGNDTAHGVERQMSFKEMLAGMITKTLAETLVKQTYLLAHRTLKAFFPGEMAINARGQWQNTDPGQWQDREHVSIDVGLSQGERMRQSQALLGVMQMQNQMVQQGLGNILTDPSKMYNALTDYCRMAGLDNPAQYWINPASPQAQQAAQAAGQQQQQAAAMQAQQQDRIISMEEFKAQTDAQNDLRDYEYKVAQSLLDSEEKADDNTREWSALELQYSVDIEGKGQ